MAKQSTRHKYRTRRERNKETARIVRLLLWGALVLLVLLAIRNWREIYNYVRFYF